MSSERKKQKNDIVVPSDFKFTDTLKYIESPEPYVLRIKAVSAAKAGDMPYGQAMCPHPVSSMDWLYDHVNEADREGRPTNLFECRLCHATLFLVDGNGKSASDG